MKQAILNCIDSHVGDLQSCSNDEEIRGVLSDIINDMYWYTAKLTNKPTKLKIGDRYIEYITSDTIGITDYKEAATLCDGKTINKLIVDII